MERTRIWTIGGLVALAIVFVAGVAMLWISSSGGSPATPTAAPTATPSATAGTPTAAPNPKEVNKSDGDTSLNFRVNGCEGCQLTATPTQGGEDLEPQTVTIASGVAQVDLPTAQTLGLVISVQGDQEGKEQGNSKLLIYSVAGASPGTPQTEAEVKSADSGSYCWAGTLLEVATMRITVTGDTANPTMAFADPALPAINGSVKLKDGAAAVPDKFDCKA